MCGIVGYTGNKNATEIVLEGLKRLEYRGYDSAGLAVIEGNEVSLVRGSGKIANLEASLRERPLRGNIAIGHTRWATHGKPSEENAHPHTSCKKDIVLVHNGIIENYRELKFALTASGHRFNSETDTEVIVHTIEKNFKGDLLDAVLKTIDEIRGAYAIAVISSLDSSRIVAARKDAPLIIGIGKDENFVASDIPAILPYTKRVVYLEDGDVADIRKDQLTIYNSGKIVERKIHTVNWDPISAEKGGYKHFMLKEIFEQPQSIRDTFRGRLDPERSLVMLDEELKIPDGLIENLQKLYIVACGTSYHAGLVGRFLFENFAKIPCEVEIASEFRYRNPLLDPKTMVLLITQSGETADTLAALRLAKSQGAYTLAVCNVVGSTASREAHSTFYTHCGPEIGVASTKAFTGQLVALYLLMLDWSIKRETLPKEAITRIVDALWESPLLVGDVLKKSNDIFILAKKFFHSEDFLFLGRHFNYPIALEGALKLKEISYIHAEGYPAGEMKHGPIALIDENMPVLVIATKSAVYEKVLSNIEEVRARLGTVIVVASQSDTAIKQKSEFQIYVPDTEEFISPLVNVIPLQLFAYYCAVLRGNDVDQPRNLAKSVTVE